MVHLPLAVQTGDLPGNPGCLILISGTGIVGDLFRGFPVCIEILLKSVLVVADHTVGTVQDTLGTAVILI